MRPRHHGDRIYKRLLLALLTGKYPPGTPLSEGSLAATFKVSRTPVREALSQLVSEGFAERVSGRGVFAARVTIQTLRDVLEVRRLLEGEAAAWAANRARPIEVASLRDLAVFQYAVGDAASYRHATERNKAFHQAVAAASHNDQVVGLIGQCLAQMELFMALGVDHDQFQEGAGSEHLAVVDAIEARDPGAARSVMEAHLDRSGDLLMRWAVSGTMRSMNV